MKAVPLASYLGLFDDDASSSIVVQTVSIRTRPSAILPAFLGVDGLATGKGPSVGARAGTCQHFCTY